MLGTQASVREVNVLLSLHHPNIVNVAEVRGAEGGGGRRVGMGITSWGGSGATFAGVVVVVVVVGTCYSCCSTQESCTLECCLLLSDGWTSDKHCGPSAAPLAHCVWHDRHVCWRVLWLQVVVGGRDGIFMVMEYVEHDLKYVMELQKAKKVGTSSSTL